MSNDIEDFLKRAAQRRQAKSSQTPVPPVKPYATIPSDRTPRNRGDVVVPMQAILLDDNHSGEPVAKHMQAIEKERLRAAKDAVTRRAGGTVKPVQLPTSLTYVVPERTASVAPQTSTGDNMGFTVADRLITMLRQPEGMMQAMLLQEILQRPEHRW